MASAALLAIGWRVRFREWHWLIRVRFRECNENKNLLRSISAA
jgi:hypothetical protein